MPRRLLFLAILTITGLLFSGCGSSAKGPYGSGSGLNIVATTTLVGDAVQQVGGNHLQLHVLLPAGVDTHSFQPTPRDVAQVAGAQLVFASGAGLEEFLKPMLENAGGATQVIYVSDNIQLLQTPELIDEAGSGGDPHVWFDPNNVSLWVDVIREKLSAADPEHAPDYARNAEEYQAKLKELDAWIESQVSQIPEAKRLLVVDHASFAYFARRYGFRQVGAIIPSYSSLSEPTAQELAALEDQIRSLGVKAIFVGETANPALSKRVAEDTGVQIIRLYKESLSAADGPAGNYLDFMRYDVAAIVAALK